MSHADKKRRKPSRKARQIDWSLIVRPLTVLIQVIGQLALVWLNRGGHLF